MKITGLAKPTHRYEACQLGIDIDDDLKFVVNLPEINTLTKVDITDITFAASPSGRTQQRKLTTTDHKCSGMTVSKKNFKEKLSKHFSNSDKLHIGQMSREDLTKQMAKKVDCIGCRKATEAMYDVLLENCKKRCGSKDHDGDNCDPVDCHPYHCSEIFTKINIDLVKKKLVLDQSVIEDEHKFYQYTHILSKRAQDLSDSLKMRRNNRCSLHSMDNKSRFETRVSSSNKNHCNNNNITQACLDQDTHPDSCICNLGYFGLQMSTKQERKRAWMNVWRNLPKACRVSICTFKAWDLCSSMTKYLDMHHFCFKCKAQIMKAFDYLIDEDRFLGTDACIEEEAPPKKKCSEKSDCADCNESDCEETECYGCYIINKKCPVIYGDIIVRHNNPETPMIHMSSNENSIFELLEKAESEMVNHMTKNGHARCAKTMQQAQEEVRTCIGIYIYERLHKVWSRIQEVQLSCSYLAAFFCENMRFKYEETLSKVLGADYMIEEALMELEGVEAVSNIKNSSKSKKKKNRSKSKKKNDLSVSSDIRSPTSSDPTVSVKIDSNLIQDLCKKLDIDSINKLENNEADQVELEQSSLEDPLLDSQSQNIGFEEVFDYLEREKNNNNNFETASNHSMDSVPWFDEDDKMVLRQRREELSEISVDHIKERFRTRFELW